eukprot:m.185359 g.185359  ORF g.185359 m.185359 type:complete len:423 (-) comp16422_c0_seq1:186-1454(-)
MRTEHATARHASPTRTRLAQHLAIAVVVAMALLCPTPVSARVSVGAVRWDAWYGAPPGDVGIVGRTVTNDLSPERFHYRLPFFAKVHPYDPVTNSTVTIQGNTSEVMTQEIQYAAQFGIDFWAFCAYPMGCNDYNPPASSCPKIQCCADNYGLSYALNQYLASPQRNQVNFSLILQANNWYPAAAHGGNETVEQEADRFITYFKMPNFQTCCGGRPVVYVLGGGQPTDQAALSVLRNRTQAALGIDPYVVKMGGPWAAAKKLGMDALSAYVVQSNPNKLAGAPFATSIAEPEANYWAQAHAAGGKLIPSITPGWDPSPREYIDLPWGDQGKTACVEALGHACYVQDPTMPELTAHTKAAVAFALANPTTVEANAVIIGAWNENDEGHWIVPSLLNGTQKLEAVQKGVQEAHDEAAAAAAQAV